ncbi:MAG: hypothetical protein HOQ05_02970 [Corynebacteriales bacterium]|nr:hypothetical protein [Mycobacteriales bacterium]
MPSQPALERTWAIAGVIIATVAAFGGGLLAIFLVPLHIGSVPVPISLLITAVINVASVQYAYRVSGWRGAGFAPMIGWFLAVCAAGIPTVEGDVVLPGTWVGLGVLFVGAIAATVPIARSMMVNMPDRGGL